MDKILIISATGMGDSLWATPAIRALKLSFPNAQIDFLVSARWRTLFHENPHIHKIYELKKGWVYQMWFKLRLTMRHYDCALVFHANKDIRRLLAWKPCPAYFHQPFPWLSQEELVAIDGPQHGIKRRLALVEKIGAKTAGNHMDLFFNDSDRSTGAEFLQKNKIAEFVYINVGASLPHKRWPADRFIALAQKILETTSYHIVLGGGPEEEALIESVKAKLNPARVAHTYDRPIRDNAYLIGQARMMVSSDSGPMHIAFALKIPTVALFAVTDPRQSGPCELADRICYLIEAPITPYTHPESAKDNPDYFAQISVAMVWEKVQEALSATGTKK
jgi:ADP-heptose:LPS heptosyltransferase